MEGLVAVEHPRVKELLWLTATLRTEIRVTRAQQFAPVNYQTIFSVADALASRLGVRGFSLLASTRVQGCQYLDKELEQVARFAIWIERTRCRQGWLTWTKKLEGFDLNDQLRLVKTSPLELAQLELFS